MPEPLPKRPMRRVRITHLALLVFVEKSAARDTQRVGAVIAVHHRIGDPRSDPINVVLAHRIKALLNSEAAELSRPHPMIGIAVKLLVGHVGPRLQLPAGAILNARAIRFDDG